jgi:hypothetical protein
LRSYSRPVSLARFDKKNWMTNEDDNWFVAEYLADIPHIPLLTRPQITALRKAHSFEIKTGKIVEWEKSKTRRSTRAKT